MVQSCMPVCLCVSERDSSGCLAQTGKGTSQLRTTTGEGKYSII
jgi:hypothetical protein